MSAKPSADIPQFEIDSRPAEDVYVVRIAGEVHMSHEEELRSGVRALLLSREAQHPEEGSERLAISASSEQILPILGVMGIDGVIPIRPTAEEAAALSG